MDIHVNTEVIVCFSVVDVCIHLGCYYLSLRQMKLYKQKMKAKDKQGQQKVIGNTY